MSSGRRRRDEIAPSLFPFLAVLLCTMGALVLILMLVVANAQASAKEIIDTKREQREETESAIELAQRAIHKQLEAGRIDLEKRRLELQHLESHIQELLDEMSELTRTAELLQADREDDSEEAELIAEKISELEQQLADAKLKLDQQLDKPDGDKPIFAIIPYDGPNGTHRRPIYIECTSDGLVIQPEGIRISSDDLQPPHGPGNPLDAALRTIRAAYTPENLAVTSTAYPLLIVRPDGVRTYALARAAMNGWDDQFGYELIDDELELAFPEGEPGLAPKISKALDLARQRQAALVMAMPKKYRRSSLRQLGSGSSSASGGYANGSPAGSDSMNSVAGERGGFSSQGLSVDSGARNSQFDQFGSQPGSQGGPSSPLGFGPEGELVARAGTNSIDAESGGGQPGDLDQSGVVSEASRFGESLFQPWNMSGNTMTGTDGPTGNSNNGLAGSDAGESGTGSSSGGEVSGSAGSANSSSANTGSRQAGQAGSSAGSLMSSDQMLAGGEQISLPNFGLQSAAGAASGPQSENAAASGSRSSSNSNRAGSSSDSSGGAQAESNGGAPRAGSEAARPVAASRGRDWAWSMGPPTQTPVIRSLHLLCTEDRWVLRADAGKTTSEVTIAMDGSLQQRAEKLADSIRQRVESWGLALSNGYWQPVLVVEVAPGAEWRYQQLTRMFEGSGIEVRRRNLNENR